MIDERRQSGFQKNPRLEALLKELNERLAPVQREINASHRMPTRPLVLVVGCPRSGTTLLLQWLAGTGAFAYPSNFLSRFYAAPFVGAQIQQMLADPAYAHGHELGAMADPVGYASALGKTEGPWSPNEFWYFWRRFIPNEYPEFVAPEDLARVDAAGMLAELAALESVFEKPWAMKGMILQQNAAFLAEALPPAIFLRIRRDPFYAMQSLLEARERFFGDRAAWYSVKPREFAALEAADPFQQVAGQVFHVNRGLDRERARIEPERWIDVRYESFCAEPAALARELAERMATRGCPIEIAGRGPEAFEATDEVRLPREDCERLVEAYAALSGEDVSP